MPVNTFGILVTLDFPIYRASWPLDGESYLLIGVYWPHYLYDFPFDTVNMRVGPFHDSFLCVFCRLHWVCIMVTGLLHLN